MRGMLVDLCCMRMWGTTWQDRATGCPVREVNNTSDESCSRWWSASHAACNGEAGTANAPMVLPPPTSLPQHTPVSLAPPLVPTAPHSWSPPPPLTRRRLVGRSPFCAAAAASRRALRWCRLHSTSPTTPANTHPTTTPIAAPTVDATTVCLLTTGGVAISSTVGGCTQRTVTLGPKGSRAPARAMARRRLFRSPSQAARASGVPLAAWEGSRATASWMTTEGCWRGGRRWREGEEGSKQCASLSRVGLC